ncbi:MAG: hypothetical protein WCA30_06160 [Dermatophilaceae bacterium]
MRRGPSLHDGIHTLTEAPAASHGPQSQADLVGQCQVLADECRLSFLGGGSAGDHEWDVHGQIVDDGTDISTALSSLVHIGPN